MKSAYVSPILKKADLDSSDGKSYRPISNLSVLSKSVEGLASQQLVAYLRENDLYCQIANQLTEHIIRQKPLCSEFCQTFCLHSILATLQF